MTDERARVEAWMVERCPHIGLRKALCPDCLLAYGAEHDDTTIRVLASMITGYDIRANPVDDPECDAAIDMGRDLLAEIRARRAGPG